MKYLMNNSKPQTIIVNQQKRIEYFDEAKKGRFTRHLIQIAMHPVGHRSDGGLTEDPEDPDYEIDNRVREENLPKNTKIIISYKSNNNTSAPFQRRDFRYTSEQRRPVNYTFPVTHYPHIIDYQIDNEPYNLFVGEVVKIPNDVHAEEIMKVFLCIDEVNEKGEVIRANPYGEGIDKNRMDTTGKVLPKVYEEIPWDRLHTRTSKRETAPKMEYSEELPR